MANQSGDPAIVVNGEAIYLRKSEVSLGNVIALDPSQDEQCDTCGVAITSFLAKARVVGPQVVCGCGAMYGIQYC